MSSALRPEKVLGCWGCQRAPVPWYFILFDTIVKGIVFLISFSEHSMLAHRNKVDLRRVHAGCYVLRSRGRRAEVGLLHSAVQAADALSQCCSSCWSPPSKSQGTGFAPGWIISALKISALAREPAGELTHNRNLWNLTLFRCEVEIRSFRTLPVFGSPLKLCEPEGAPTSICTPCSPWSSPSSQGHFPPLQTLLAGQKKHWT